jgi:hypothetical protein
MSIEGNELRSQLTNLVNEGAYQLGLGSLADMRGAERIYSPTFRLAACNQGTNANDLMQRMFWKTFSERFPDFGLGGVAHVEHPRRCCEVGDGLQVPNDY